MSPLVCPSEAGLDSKCRPGCRSESQGSISPIAGQKLGAEDAFQQRSVERPPQRKKNLIAVKPLPDRCVVRNAMSSSLRLGKWDGVVAESLGVNLQELSQVMPCRKIPCSHWLCCWDPPAIQNVTQRVNVRSRLGSSAGERIAAALAPRWCVVTK